jgi:hypothetical protein
MVKHLLRFVKGALAVSVLSIPALIVAALCKHYDTVEVVAMCLVGLMSLGLVYLIGCIFEE